MTMDDLVDRIVGVVGKDAARCGRILRSGTLLEASTRIRWDGLEAAESEIHARLARFPDPDPALPFVPGRCQTVEFADSSGRSLPLPKSDAAAKRWFRRQSFWDVLMRLARDETPRYVTYSYRDKADRYHLALSVSLASRIRESAGLLVHGFHARQLKTADLASIDFLVPRES